MLFLIILHMRLEFVRLKIIFAVMSWLCAAEWTQWHLRFSSGQVVKLLRQKLIRYKIVITYIFVDNCEII